MSFECEPRVIMFQQKKNNEYVNTFELDCEYLNGDHLGMYRFMWFSELLNIAKDKAEGLKMGQKPKADLLQRIKQFIGLKQK
ncbi:MAG: hypothetical protein MJ187_04435 [Alphaproteobacteria bacterium]|nr:hypothetical protein [Alphaproteobacteria bacterium]